MEKYCDKFIEKESLFCKLFFNLEKKDEPKNLTPHLAELIKASYNRKQNNALHFRNWLL